MGRETFRGLTECRTLHHLVDRYMKTLLSQLFLSSGCNRFHSATERCARWLLMMHDRYETGEFPFTQDFLSEMLGVRRQSVAVMEATLERAGLIQTRRGCVAILDRAGLETVACECYKRVKAEFDLYLNGGKAPAVTGHECAPSPIH
jgi:CRP-like cAMP-binding protein